MTIIQLQALDIIHCQSKLKPRLFFIPYIGERIIPEEFRIEEIYSMIFNAGVEHGIRKGEENKINQFKKLFNIDYAD